MSTPNIIRGILEQAPKIHIEFSCLTAWKPLATSEGTFLEEFLEAFLK